MFSILLWDNQIHLDEIFYDMVKEAKEPNRPYHNEIIDYLIEDWERYRAYHRIYTRMDELKYDKIDWARGVEDGIFSLMNYYQIPELKEFREIGNKQFLDDYPKEKYSKGLEVIKELEEKYHE